MIADGRELVDQALDVAHAEDVAHGGKRRPVETVHKGVGTKGELEFVRLAGRPDGFWKIEAIEPADQFFTVSPSALT